MSLFVALSSEMQTLDRYVMEELGIFPEILMERAGLGVAEKVKEYFPRERFSRVLVLSGPGNNGGDSFVVGRYLWDWGYQVEILLFSEENKYSPEAKRNLEVIKTLGVPVSKILSFSDFQDYFKHYAPELIIDGLFGTGLKRPVKGIYEEVILFVNEEKKKGAFKIISIDLPSGISTDTGEILGVAIEADLTVTFECLKAGQLFYPGKEFCGTLEVVSIGYPWRYLREAKPEILPKRIYLDLEEARRIFRPRKGFYHKGRAGYVLILAGSEGKSGAGLLAALGALKAGAGLVTLASTKSLQAIYSSMKPEILTLGLPEKNGEITEEALPYLIEALRRKKSLVIGPGLGLGEGVERVLFQLLEKNHLPLVLDADALTHLSRDLEFLKKCAFPKVLTPHPGEAARLLKVETLDVLRDPLSALKEIINLTGAVVVLKGPHTLIGEPGGRIYISSIDEPGMAQGGMGDVLSGMIGAFLAQGYLPFTAAALSVYLHGEAGRYLRGLLGPFGFTATEVAETIPKMINLLEG